ncbi:MAG TPA: hypothetical protein VHD56_02455 [Tepidisphaeraceae bacterium]|nr:hypothetical protein [Tepidisphaeraceae bacterium]
MADDAYRSLVSPKNAQSTFNLLWLDDHDSLPGDINPVLRRKLEGLFDIRHCRTPSRMRDLVFNGKWFPDAVLADWDMSAAGTSETDDVVRAALDAPAAGLLQSMSVSKDLRALGHFCRVIPCSAFCDAPLLEMARKDPKLGPIVAAVMEMWKSEPAILERELAGGLKSSASDTRSLLSIVAKSYRKGLTLLAEAGQLTGSGYLEWIGLRKRAGDSKTSTELHQALNFAGDGLALNCDRSIPTTALFADMSLNEVFDFASAQATLTEFCTTLSTGKWHELILTHTDSVYNVFHELLNLWPVRLLRDGEIQEEEDIRALAALSGRKLQSEKLENWINWQDADAATCVIAMLVVLEACHRAYLCSVPEAEIAANCSQVLETREDDVHSEADTVIVDITRGTEITRGVCGTSSLIAACRGTWDQHVNLDHVTRLFRPLCETTDDKTSAKTLSVPTYDTGKGAARALARNTHWKIEKGKTATKIADMSELRAAIDRFLVDVATSQRIHPDEVRRRMHPDLVLAL